MSLPNKLSAALSAAILLASPALGAGRALLWVPDGNSALPEVLGLLENNKDARLTAALPLPVKGLEGRVRKLADEGRLELARRPAGDPPLPLLYYAGEPVVAWEGKPEGLQNPDAASYFLSLRLGMSRDEAAAAYGKAPAGLVSPPGGLVPDYFPLAGALGVKWIACCPAVSTGTPLMQYGGVYAVPFAAYTSSFSAAGERFVVFDETTAPDPAAARAELERLLTAAGTGDLATVSAELEKAVSTQAAPSEIAAAFRPWSGDYSRWASAPLQAGALSALRRTRADLMSYLNSEQGNFTQAEPAFREYFSAENGPGLLVLASTDAAGEAELDLRNTLANAYRLMNKPPPPWAFSSLADAASTTAQDDKISVTDIPGGFELTNVRRDPVMPPAPDGSPAPAEDAPYWKLEALRVSVSTAGSLFEFRPGAIDQSVPSPSGFGRIRLDLYMDVNHRARAGVGHPLEGRPLRIYPDSAWEYALEVSSEGASLYKITPEGPRSFGQYKVSVRDGWIRAALPPGALRGTPSLWSYAALLLAPKDGGYAIADYIAEDISNGYIYAFRPGRQ